MKRKMCEIHYLDFEDDCEYCKKESFKEKLERAYQRAVNSGS